MPGTAPELPPVRVSTLGIWSTDDHDLDGKRMERSGAYVQAPSRYEVIEGASHWIPLDAADRLNALLLLLHWLHGPATGGNWPSVTPSHLGAHNEGSVRGLR